MNGCHDASQPICQLAAGGLRGNASGAWELLELTWGALERFVHLRLLRTRIPPLFLEECAQNVFTRVWKYRTTYRGTTQGEFWRWLGRICDNERRRILSREARRAVRPLPQDDCGQHGVAALTSRTEPHEQATVNEEIAGLRDCLRKLDARRRRVIELAYFEPVLPERAIAELLGYSAANVHKLKAEALDVLRACLERKGIR